MQFLPCFLCSKQLEKRADKHGKPYFVCDPCGIQLFVRKKYGIEKLQQLLDTAEKNEIPFKQAAHRVYQVQALLSEIDGTKAQIQKLEKEIGFFFPEEDKVRAHQALKLRLRHLIEEFEKFCGGTKNTE